MKTGFVAFLLSALLLTVSLMAYAGNRLETKQEEANFPPELVVVGDASGFPEGCDPITLAHIVLNFFDAYNQGEEERFAEVFPPNFTWYADGQPEKGWHFLTTSREELISYFAERHRQNERLSLIALHLGNSKTDRPDLIHMSFSVYRQADDLEMGLDGRARFGGGKGAMLCSKKQIYVWGMFIAPPHETSPMWSEVCEKAFLTPSPQNLTATAVTQAGIDSGAFIPPNKIPSVTVCIGKC